MASQPPQSSSSGASTQSDDLRRRNIPDAKTNGQARAPVVEDDKKKQMKKVYTLRSPRAGSPKQYDSIADDARQTQQSVLNILDEWEFLIAPIIFTALAFFTRMWKIGLSPIVTWDEAQ